MPAPERRLTAIFCADVVGYSRLVGREETGTLARLDEARAIMRTMIEEHGGRVFNLAGDGLFAEFPSALGAVQAAVACQDRLGLWAASQPEDSRMRLRIGINLGDVVVSGGDLLGDGVNVAARLQALAAPGGICLSEAVYGQVRGRIETDIVDLGFQAMKNMAEPIRAYALRVGTDPARPEEAAPEAAASAARGDVSQRGNASLRGNPLLSYFLPRLSGALIVLAVLLVINLTTTPHRIWVHWPALGFAVALVLPIARHLLWGRPMPKGRDRAA